MRCGVARCAFARHHQCVRNYGRPMEYHDRVYHQPDVDRRHTFRSFEACSLAASFSSAAANDEVSRRNCKWQDKCLTGGVRHGDNGYFIEPTLFDNVTDDMSIATDEIFGPVMSILKFKDMDELIERANNTFYGLAAAVWSRDIGKAHNLADKVRAGTVWVNCYDVFDAAAPFGGFKMSGIGRELGEEGLKNYLETKTVTVALD